MGYTPDKRRLKARKTGTTPTNSENNNSGTDETARGTYSGRQALCPARRAGNPPRSATPGEVLAEAARMLPKLLAA